MSRGDGTTVFVRDYTLMGQRRAHVVEAIDELNERVVYDAASRDACEEWARRNGYRVVSLAQAVREVSS